MISLIVTLLISALLLLLVAKLLPGFEVDTFGVALISAILIGLANMTVGLLLKSLAFPLTILTLGLTHLLINALMLKLVAALMPGFRINGCLPAILGALIISVANILLRSMGLVA